MVKRKTTKKGSDPETSQACEYCGSKDGVSVRTDPYAHELYDDETLHAMCDDCAHERAMDI